MTQVLQLVEGGMGAKLLVEVMLDRITQQQQPTRTAGQSGPYLDFPNACPRSPGDKAAGGSSFAYEGQTLVRVLFNAILYGGIHLMRIQYIVASHCCHAVCVLCANHVVQYHR